MQVALQVVEKQTFELPSLGEAWLIAQIAAVRVENRQYAVVAIAASDGLALGELQVCPCPGSLVIRIPCHPQASACAPHPGRISRQLLALTAFPSQSPVRQSYA